MNFLCSFVPIPVWGIEFNVFFRLPSDHFD
jgi:hypothetical protein